MTSWSRALLDLGGALRRRTMPRTRVLRAVELAVRTRLGWRPLHDWVVDLRYGGWAGGREPNPFAAAGATPIQSTPYAALHGLFRANGIEVRDDDVLVDVGCGRGRVLNAWLSRGLRNRMVGIEIVPAVAERARQRLRRHANVTVVCGDAVGSIPPEGTLYYLYNPFDAAVMERFAEALLARALRPERLRIVYFNPRQAHVFARDPRWRVAPLRTPEPEGAVLVSVHRPGNHA